MCRAKCHKEVSMKLIIISLFLGLIGCSNNNNYNDPFPAHEELEQNVVVYISKAKTQCNNDGLRPDKTIKSLANTGIDVPNTYCGATTGLAFRQYVTA
jgi:hypothetical protein